MTGQPIDRVHFLDEQRRNRRRSRRFTVFAVVAVAVSGIPLCVVVAPIFLGAIIVLMHVADLVAPLSQSAWDRLHDVVFALPELWSFVRGRPVDIAWSSIALIYVVPGAVLMLLVWPFMLALSRQAGAGTMLNRLAARDIDHSAPIERQLVNVVEEIAIAAGVTPPKVRIIDTAAVNAVAVGLTSDDATILATTGFLERLDRDERQAIIAHLVGSVGNGDLQIGATILSVLATWGLISLILEAPVSGRRRATLKRLLRFGAPSLRGGGDREEANALLELLLGGSAFDMGVIEDIENIGPRSVAQAFLILILLPLIGLIGFASITARTTLALCTALGLGPWLAAMWRSRRRLADASAVQLTRHPTALASAVRSLEASDVEVPGGWVAYFLFPIWVPVSAKNASQTEAASNIVGMRLETGPRLESIVALGAMLDTVVRRPGWRTRLARLGTWKDLRTAVGWGLVAIVLCALLIAVTLSAASLVLIALWQGARFLNPRR